MENQHSQFAETRQNLSLISGKEEGLQRRLDEREAELQELTTRNCQILSEVEDLRKNETIRGSDNERLINDIQTVTKENQFVKNELKKAADERDHYRNQMERAAGDAKHFEQSVRAVEIDKQDVQSSYKEVCHENMRLKDANSKLGFENKEVVAQLATAEQEIAKLDCSNRELVDRELALRGEIRNREDSISHLTSQCDMMAREREHVSQFGHSAAQEADHARQVTATLE